MSVIGLGIGGIPAMSLKSIVIYIAVAVAILVLIDALTSGGSWELGYL